MRERVIALGFFDGVHLGHGALLRRAAEEAQKRGCESAVFTFDRPPKEVITGIPCPLINSPEDRAALVKRLYGIDEMLMVPFDDEMRTTPWDRFVTDILVGRCGAVHLVAGHDHHFGHKNQGSPELLKEKCAELGLGCDIIPAVTLDGVTVSSTHIRKLLEEGDVETARAFLGHPHVLTQTVGHGRQLGRTFGIPTANLVAPPHVLLPKRGVYAAKITLPDGRAFGGVTNVGVRPTVNNGQDVTVEPWILDFDGDLYGQAIRVEFFQRLRDERKFESLEALRSQIETDAVKTREACPEMGL